MSTREELLQKMKAHSVNISEASRFDADDEEGRWVTTESGKHMFINGEGEPTKGNPHVLAAAKGESKSSKSSGKAISEAFKTGGKIAKIQKEFGISDSDMESFIKENGGDPNKAIRALQTAKKISSSPSAPKVGEKNSGNSKEPNTRLGKKELSEMPVGSKVQMKDGSVLTKTSDRELPWKKEGSSDKYSTEHLANSNEGAVTKSGSSAKTYSVQDDKAKTNEFNKIIQGINGQEKASEMLDTLPVGTVLESETAFFRKTDDGKWIMSDDGYFLSDPAHYSPNFASMVCEAGHTNIVLPKSATEGKSSPPKTAAKKDVVKPKGNEYSGMEYLSRVTGNGSDSEKEYQKNFFKNASDEDKKSALELEMSSMFSSGYPSDEKMKKAVSDFKDFGVYEDFKKTYDDYFGRSGEFDRDWGHVVGDRDVPEMKRSSRESKKAIKSVLDRSGFWTRDNEMEDDFKDAGFDVLENNDEYVVVSDNKSDSDTQYQMRKFRGGGSFTLEPPTAISFGGEEDFGDEDDEEDW